MKKNDLIPLEEDFFHYNTLQTTRKSNARNTDVAARKDLSRYVMQLVTDGILNPNLNAKQQVLSLRRTSISSTACHIFKSSGLIDNKELSTLTYLVNQMKVLLKAPRMTRSIRGWPTDEQRSLVESVLYACVTTP